MTNRRRFIKNTSLGVVGLTFLSKKIFAEEEIKKITILHTNDMHSRIEPFKSGSYKDFGGMAQRSFIIKEIRERENNVLLFDAGDIFQGTPYLIFLEEN